MKPLEPQHHLRPPRLMEWLIGKLLPFELGEMILGDFAEEYARYVEKNGRFSATFWYAQQLLRSIPALFRLNLNYQLERRWIPMIKSLSNREKQTFVIGILLLIPIMLVSIPGIIYSAFGQPAPMNAVSGFLESNAALSLLIHPVVVMGGLLIAFLLNALPVFSISLNNQNDRIVGSISLKKDHILQLTFVGICLLFGLVIFIYMLAENFHLFQSIR